MFIVKFEGQFFKYIFFGFPSTSFTSGISMTYLLACLMLSHRSLRHCSCYLFFPLNIHHIRSLQLIYIQVYWFNSSTFQGPRVLLSFWLSISTCVLHGCLWKKGRGQESAAVLWDVYITYLCIPLYKKILYNHNLIAREAGKFISL